VTFSADIHYSIFPPRAAAVARLESDYIFFREYINRLTWSLDARNRTEIVAFRIYRKPKTGGDDLYALLAEVPKSSLTDYAFEHRGLRKDDLFVYRVIAIDSNGVESPAAEVSN
jgi:hypothetical protein